MNIENLNFTNNVAQEGPIELVIREGQAAKQLDPNEPIVLGIKNGNYLAPFEYASHFYGKDKYPKALVTYSKDPKESFLILSLDPENKQSPFVMTEIKSNPDLLDFKFNSDNNTFDNESFSKLIMRNAHCFSSIQDAKDLRSKLNNFSVNFQTQVESLDDKKGNTKAQVRTILDREKSGIPEEIAFKMPLIQGGAEVEFTASVEIEVKGNGNHPVPAFGFFSLEMKALLRNSFSEMIKGEIDKFVALGIPCIEVMP